MSAVRRMFRYWRYECASTVLAVDVYVAKLRLLLVSDAMGGVRCVLNMLQGVVSFLLVVR